MFDKLKNFLTKSNDQLFSSLAVLPFSKYKKNYGQKDYLNAYDISLYANRAINKRAQKVGEVEFQLMKGDEPVESHDVLDLLAKPNDAFTASEFWGLWQKYYDIFGEVYCMRETELRMGGKTRTNQLHLLRSDLVKPHFDKNTGQLTKIEYRTAEGTETISGEDVIYAHNPNPSSPLRGESLISAGIRQVEMATQIDEYHSKILENGGRIEGVFNIKNENVSRKQLQELKDQYQEQYGNASKAGLPLFMGGNATYQRLGLDPSELAYLDTKEVNLNDIVLLTGVPKAVLGVTSDETFANSDAAIRVFLRETIKPLIGSLVTKLNEDLVEDELELTYVDPTPEDQEEKRKNLETAHKINAMTLNEKRTELGLDEIDGGDTIYAPMNVMPLDTGDTEEPEERSVKKKIHHPLRNKENRRSYHALQVKRLDRRQRKMLDVMQDYFIDQQERIVDRITERKQFKTKSLLDEVFNTSIEIKLAKETVLPVLEELLKESAEDAKEITDSDWQYQHTAEVDSWLDKKTDVFAKQINNTTFKKLKTEFATSLEAGETRQELIGRIKDTYKGITDGRAEVIARTEVHGVTQYGTMEGYRQGGMPINIWVWAPGTQGGVRENHQAMDGEEVPLNTAFSNGLMFPGDPSGSAGENVNCQCFI